MDGRPAKEGASTIKVAPISQQAFSNLQYEKWVDDRRAMVEKLSGGEIGYLHIRQMDQPSLQKFEKDLAAQGRKKAMIIDQRFNPGGNIDQELLEILGQKQYQYTRQRDSIKVPRPLRGFFGPMVVMENKRSTSDAEVFPDGFKTLKLGKVVGVTSYGAVIGTGDFHAHGRIEHPHAGIGPLERERYQSGELRRPAGCRRRQHTRRFPERPRRPDRESGRGAEGGDRGEEVRSKRAACGLAKALKPQAASEFFMTPFNLHSWVEENRHLLKPPVGNSRIWRTGNSSSWSSADPTQRSDYHINPGEELFYQIEGDIVFKIIEDGKPRDIPIKQGEHVPAAGRRAALAATAGEHHRPRRRASESSSQEHHLRWYCRNCGGVVHDFTFRPADIGKQIKAALAEFNGNEALRTCKACGEAFQV